MGFVVDLEPDLDRAVAVIAAQNDQSKAAVVLAAVRAYVSNHIVTGRDGVQYPITRERVDAALKYIKDTYGSVKVNVAGTWTSVRTRSTIGAIVTDARWHVGGGSLPFDNWEVRDKDGNLLDPLAAPGDLTEIHVNQKAGVGG